MFYIHTSILGSNAQNLDQSTSQISAVGPKGKISNIFANV